MVSGLVDYYLLLLAALVANGLPVYLGVSPLHEELLRVLLAQADEATSDEVTTVEATNLKFFKP